MLVHARADVLGDVGVGIAGGAQQCVVGLADSQEEGRVVAGGQLDNVRHQGCGTEPKHMDTWGWQKQDGRSPLSHTGHPGTTQPWGTHKHWDGSSAVSGVWMRPCVPAIAPGVPPLRQAGLPPRLQHNVPTNLTVRRRKELKLQPPALMLPSAPARPFSLDCRQYTMPSPTMIWGRTDGSGRAAPRQSGGPGCRQCRRTDAGCWQAAHTGPLVLLAPGPQAPAPSPGSASGQAPSSPPPSGMSPGTH